MDLEFAGEDDLKSKRGSAEVETGCEGDAVFGLVLRVSFQALGGDDSGSEFRCSPERELRDAPAGMPVSPQRGTDIPVCALRIGQTPGPERELREYV